MFIYTDPDPFTFIKKNTGKIMYLMSLSHFAIKYQYFLNPRYIYLRIKIMKNIKNCFWTIYP